MDEDKVCFEIDGKKFQILIADKNLETMHTFAARTFTTAKAIDLAGTASEVEFEKMRRGIITEGMTEAQVLVTYGRPTVARTPKLEINTWIYQIGPVQSRRVIFVEGEDEDKPRTVSKIFEL